MSHKQNLLVTDQSEDKPSRYGSNIQESKEIHSDDEIDPRRGLENSSERGDIPQEPLLLRQSTHSLLGKTKYRGVPQTFK